MNNFLTKYKPYAWLLLPFVLIVFFLVLLINSFSEDKKVTQEDQVPIAIATPIKAKIDSPTPQIAQSHKESVMAHDGIDEVWPTGFEDFYGDSDPSGLENVQKVENLTNGSIRYTYTSSKPSRPNIIIAKENRTIYQRSIPQPNADIPVENIIKIFGQPERIINGPSFYGNNTTTEYIYAQEGVSVVVNKQSGQVVEHHYFRPTTVDEYLRNFGNDGSPLSN